MEEKKAKIFLYIILGILAIITIFNVVNYSQEFLKAREYTSQKQEVSKQKQDTKSDLSKLSDKYNDLEKKYEPYKEIENKQDELTEVNKKKSNAEQDLENSKSDLEEANSKLAKIKADEKDADQKLEDAQSEQTKAENELTSAENELEDAQSFATEKKHKMILGECERSFEGNASCSIKDTALVISPYDKSILISAKLNSDAWKDLVKSAKRTARTLDNYDLDGLIIANPANPDMSILVITNTGVVVYDLGKNS